MKKVIFIAILAVITITTFIYEPVIKKQATNNSITIENAEALANGDDLVVATCLPTEGICSIDNAPSSWTNLYVSTDTGTTLK